MTAPSPNQLHSGSGDFMIGSLVWPGLSNLVEEAGESLQVCGKLMGSAGSTDHWSGDLARPLHDELADLYAALDFFVEANPQVDGEAIRQRRAKKYLTFRGWHIRTRRELEGGAA